MPLCLTTPFGVREIMRLDKLELWGISNGLRTVDASSFEVYSKIERRFNRDPKCTWSLSGLVVDAVERELALHLYYVNSYVCFDLTWVMGGSWIMTPRLEAVQTLLSVPSHSAKQSSPQSPSMESARPQRPLVQIVLPIPRTTFTKRYLWSLAS